MGNLVVGRKLVRSGLGVLVLTVGIVACSGSSVTIKTLNSNDAQEGCYTSGIAGELVTDPTAGTAIIDTTGRRYVVTWPGSWTGRRSGSEVEIINRLGKVAYKTGTQVNLSGGFSYVDESFIVCGLEPITP
jgi:hypothetical protein